LRVNEKLYTDEELAERYHIIVGWCCGGNDGNNFYLIGCGTSYKNELVFEKRIKRYCKKHKIKTEDYHGVIPHGLCSACVKKYRKR
jgi:hypothetical protein